MYAMWPQTKNLGLFMRLRISNKDSDSFYTNKTDAALTTCTRFIQNQ